MEFEKFGLNQPIVDAIAASGFVTSTPIQEKVIPLVLENRDLIGVAQTGTGKTAAFLIPLLHKIMNSPTRDSTYCLILVPTRELALQIDQHVQGLSYFTNVYSFSVYGGRDASMFTTEKSVLQQAATPIIVATPGRLIAHLTLNYVDFSKIGVLVLDEADRMLDMGFHEDITKILSYLPTPRQNLLFSATMPPAIRNLCKEFLVDPEEVSISIGLPPEKIVQVGFFLSEAQKVRMVTFILDKHKANRVVIFCATKIKAKQLKSVLTKNMKGVDAIHSDLRQEVREQVMEDFKSKKISTLVATDIISRGIDVEDIDLIVNYDLPNEPEDYVHRVGRTARAEKDGVAFTLFTPHDLEKIRALEKFLKKKLSIGSLPSFLTPPPSQRTGR